MTHQWKPGDRGRIGFTLDDIQDGRPALAFDGFEPYPLWMTGIDELNAVAEFVAPPMPGPGEWTGPGLTPIYEVRPKHSAELLAVVGETNYGGEHRIAIGGWGDVRPSDLIEWRRIGDSE